MLKQLRCLNFRTPQSIELTEHVARGWVLFRSQEVPVYGSAVVPPLNPHSTARNCPSRRARRSKRCAPGCRPPASSLARRSGAQSARDTCSPSGCISAHSTTSSSVGPRRCCARDVTSQRDAAYLDPAAPSWCSSTSAAIRRSHRRSCSPTSSQATPALRPCGSWGFEHQGTLRARREGHSRAGPSPIYVRLRAGSPKRPSWSSARPALVSSSCRCPASFSPARTHLGPDQHERIFLASSRVRQDHRHRMRVPERFARDISGASPPPPDPRAFARSGRG